MQNNDVFLLALATMEAYRLSHIGRPDFDIRACEAILAMALGYESRTMWVERLRQDGIFDYANDTMQQQYKTLFEQIQNEVK